VFPDGFKGMLKGVVKGLGIQKKVIPISISGHWLIGLSLQYWLGLHLKMGNKGLWLGSLVLEIYVLIGYRIMIGL
jgi:Na+-driven multidrug efflux pump